jgi:glyoxylase-like metal-dependent hydrolase (beta-lactamase superfamily II)
VCDEILPDLYRITVPLPGSPLKATNCYAIKGTRRSLVVDTGWNRRECREALVSGLEECGLDLVQADFLVTHLHADHTGLVSALAGDGARVYCGRADAQVMQSTSPEHWQQQIDFALQQGFPPEELEMAIGSHPGRIYSAGSSPNLCVLQDGDTVGIGNYLFECVETPGHTAGHICLYERSHRMLVCGDHILSDITPNITLSSNERNPLREYLMSLDKVHDLDVELVLPGHRRIFRNHRQRIGELRDHHRARLDEVVSILMKGRQNAFQVAGQMTWDINCRTWALFPLIQKLFAFAEALAHLRYLEEQGVVGWEMDGNGALFFIASDAKEAYR